MAAWLLGVGAVAFSAAPCVAESVAKEVKLTASDADAGDEFGASVAVAGDTAVVGAFLSDAAGTNSGSAYVYRFDGTGWVEDGSLTASDTTVGDRFGASVAVAGETAVVGAPLDDDAGGEAGAAYVFRYDGVDWVEEAKLTASDAVPQDELGWSVAVDGDTAVIGAYLRDEADALTGAAYVFRYDGADWAEEAKLTASDADAVDRFGRSVAISGDTAVVGASGNDDAGFSSGSAYVFRYDGAGWVEEAKLTASDAAGADLFGWSVAVDGDTVAVGALFDDADAIDSGSAYVFYYDGARWVEEAKLTASDAAADDEFGSSVAVAGDTVAVGARSSDAAGSNSGSAYLFRYDGAGWVEAAKLTAADAAAGDEFGTSVAVAGDTAVVGASLSDDAGSDSGSAYVIFPVPEPSTQVLQLAGLVTLAVLGRRSRRHHRVRLQPDTAGGA